MHAHAVTQASATTIVIVVARFQSWYRFLLHDVAAAMTVLFLLIEPLTLCVCVCLSLSFAKLRVG